MRERCSKWWPFALAAPADARRFAAAALRTWGWDELEDSAAVIVSELATNAVVHAGAGFALCVDRLDSGVLLSVSDASASPLHPAGSDGSEERGRGLLIVAALAHEWGVSPHEQGGKTVWALLLAGAP